MSVQMLGELSRVFQLEAEDRPRDRLWLLHIARALYFRAKAAMALSIFL